MGRIKTAVTKGVQKETAAVLLLEPSLDDEEQDVSSAANETVDAVSSSSSSSSSLLSLSLSSFSQRRILLCCSSDVLLVVAFRGVAKSLPSAADDDPTTPTTAMDDSCDSGARPRIGFAFMTASRAFNERHPRPSCLAISSIVMVDAAAKLRKARMGGTGCSCPSFSDKKDYCERGKSDENFRCPRCRVSLHWTCLSSGSSSTTGQDFVQRGSSLTNDVL